MTDRPIIFSAPMILALLDGRKTQTRRVLKPKWRDGANQQFTGWRVEQVGPRHWQIIGGMGVGANIKTPYAIGDRLYVREAFIGPYAYEVNEYPPRDWGNKPIWFPADGPVPDKFSGQFWHRARPSIHMPRWASRLTLTVTDVRVQRLQEISADDAVAEGCYFKRWITGEYPFFDQGVEADNRALVRQYRDLWNSLHGPDAWDANPWIVAVSFTVKRGNIDQIGGDA